MLITRKSDYSGVERTLDIPCTQEELDSWQEGILSQKAFPNCTPDQREFIISGITGEEWEEMFPPELDYPDDIEEPAF